MVLLGEVAPGGKLLEFRFRTGMLVGNRTMTPKLWARIRRLILGGLTILTLSGTSLWGGPLQDTSADSQATESASATSSTSAPDMQEVIWKFAENEAEFRRARENYTYRQIVKVQELSSEGDVGGTYQVDSDIIFTLQGARTEKVVYAPLSTLRKISISPEDERDLKSIQPFVLTTEELPKYNVQYQGRQKVDELSTYVFRVSPRRLEKGERYFEAFCFNTIDTWISFADGGWRIRLCNLERYRMFSIFFEQFCG